MGQTTAEIENRPDPAKAARSVRRLLDPIGNIPRTETEANFGEALECGFADAQPANIGSPVNTDLLIGLESFEGCTADNLQIIAFLFSRTSVNLKTGNHGTTRQEMLI